MPPILGGIEMEIWRRFTRRFFTPSGVAVQLPVTLAATSVVWTFPRAEVDTSYGAHVSTNWLTTMAITTKTTTSLTVTFGTGAPANATCDLLTFRSE